jgi:hypothetical protein
MLNVTGKDMEGDRRKKKRQRNFICAHVLCNKSIPAHFEHVGMHISDRCTALFRRTAHSTTIDPP